MELTLKHKRAIRERENTAGRAERDRGRERERERENTPCMTERDREREHIRYDRERQG